MQVALDETDMAERAADTQEPPSNWRVSVAFWLCLFVAAGLYGGVYLAPGGLEYLEVRHEYVLGQHRLVQAERHIAYLEEVASALENDPAFLSEVARIDLNLTGEGERIPVAEPLAMHAVQEVPEFAEPPPPQPWFMPPVRLLAELTVLRWTILALSAGVVLFAFTYLQSSQPLGLAGLLRDAFGILGRRYLRD